MGMTPTMKRFLSLLNEHGKLYGFRSNPTARALWRLGEITITRDSMGPPSWAVFELVR